MKTILLEKEQLNIYDINDFPYDRLKKFDTVENTRHTYVNKIATFDIETTTMSVEKCSIFGNDFGFMYVWQFCIDGIVVMGRTWDEYVNFIHKLERIFRPATLVIWVHNLSFEFQFMRNFFKFTDVFAKKERVVIRAVAGLCEYRCSLMLSNMGLNKFTQKTRNVIHKKRDGEDFNYKILRYPDTELSNDEYGYCVCDVLGLYECLVEYLKDDTLLTIPMTSTGYVRRDFRDRCLADPKYKFHMMKLALNSETYTLCREASRGAISGSNHIHTNVTLDDVDSFDIKSSYPFQMATKYYPQSKFVEFQAKYGTEKFEKLINNMCCILVWECRNLRLKHWESIPYISKAKCRAIEKGKVGNGKVYGAKRIGMCCTEIDFRIIRDHYRFDEDSVVIHKIFVAQRGMLDKSFREFLLYMFQEKTDLEDGDKFLYDKFKNKINAAFGMMLTDILHPTIIYNQYSNEDVWSTETVADIDKELLRYYRNKNTFLSYQHGVWVLAHGRDDLYKGIDIVGDDIVQTDTDSVKTLGNYKEEFNQLNQTIIDKAESYDIKPYSMKNGNKHYLGVWEHEGKENETTYKMFKTLGAKKYCYTEDMEEIHTTVAGLSKSACKWLQENGSFDAFSPGIIVPEGISGRTNSLYNDMKNPTTIIIDGHWVTLGSNIAIRDSEYTFGITSEWLMMILDGDISDDSELVSNGAFKGW